MSTKNPYIVQAELLVRDGARGKQAMWVAFRCPMSGKIRTMWGAVQSPTGSTPRVQGSLGLRTTLQFSQQKDAGASVSSVSSLYSKKRGKYESAGLCELDVSILHISPLRRVGSSQPVPASVEPEPAVPSAKKSPALPKEITHPEAMKRSATSGTSWFF